MMDAFDQLVGQLAVQHGYVTQPQLERCIAAQQSGPPQPLSRVMLDYGFITGDQCVELETHAEQAGASGMMPSSSGTESGWGSASESAFDLGESDVFGFDEDQEGFGGATIIDVPNSIGGQSPPTVRPVGGMMPNMGSPSGQVRPVKPLGVPDGAAPTVRPVKPIVRRGTGHQQPPAAGSTPVMPIQPVQPVRPVQPISAPKVTPVRPVSAVPISPIQPGVPDEAASAMQELFSMAEADVSLVGETFAKCEIVEEIGEGGMGRIYKARHTFLDKVVAVKVLASDLVEDQKFIDRFFREAQSASKLDHPNIVRTIDAGQENGRYYMVLDFVQGKNLAELLAEKGRFSVPDALYVAKEICRALIAAHEAGIVHRDIKPENIMIDGPRVKVLDFGLAKIDTGQQVDLTVPGQILGSPHYISPEQAKGEPVDARTDIYSLGAVFYKMLTGRVPYDSENPMAIVMMHANDPLVAPREHVPDLPAIVDRLVIKMMHKQKDGRPRSARVLLGALEKLDFGASAMQNSKPMPELTVSQLGAPVPRTPAAPITPVMPARGSGQGAAHITESAAGRANLRVSLPQTGKIVRKPVSQAMIPVFGAGSNDGTQTPSGAMEVHAEPLIDADETAVPMQVDDVFFGESDDHFGAGDIGVPDAVPMGGGGGLDVSHLLAEAREKLAAGDGVGAEAIIEEILRTAPENIDVYELQEQLMAMRSDLQSEVEKGIELAQGNQIPDAIDVFEQILQIEPNHRIATIQLKQLKSKMADAAKQLAEAKKLAKAGNFDAARRAISEGLMLVPTHGDLQAMHTKLEQRAEFADALIAEAREHASAGDTDEAVATLNRLLEKVPNHTGAQKMLDDMAERARRYQENFDAGVAAFEAADFKTAFEHFQLALNANPSCEQSRQFIAECEPILAEYHMLMKEAEALANNGDLRGAIAIWQQILDELAPGDQEAPQRIAVADEAIKKLARLEQTAENAMKKRQFDVAVKTYQQILRTNADHDEAAAGLKLAEKKLRAAKRRKRIRNLFLVMVLMAGAFAGAGYWLYIQDQTIYAEAKALIDEARADANVETARVRYQSAREKLSEVQNSVVAMVGVIPPDVAELLAATKTEVSLKEAEAAESAGDLDRALKHYAELGEAGADRVKRIQLVQAAEKHARMLKALREQLATVAEWGDYAGLADGSLETKAVTQRMAVVLNAARDTSVATEAFTALGRPTDVAIEVPTLDALTAEEQAKLAVIADEQKRFSAFAAVFDEVAPRWNLRWRELLFSPTNDPNADIQPIFRGYEAELDRLIHAADGSAWPEKFEPLLAPYRAYRAFLPVMTQMQSAWVTYIGGWQRLSAMRPDAPASIEQIAAAFATARQQFSDAATIARQQLRRGDFNAVPKLRDDTDAIARWLDRAIEHVGTEPRQTPKQFQPGMTVLDALAVLRNLPRRDHLMFYTPTPDTKQVYFVRTDLLTQGEFDAFVKADYYNPAYWKEVLAKFEGMSDSFLRRRLEMQVPPPTVTAATATASSLSLFQVEAFMQWREKAVGDGARMLEKDELLAMFQRGLKAGADARGDFVGEWVDSPANPPVNDLGDPMGMRIAKQGSALVPTTDKKAAKEGVGFRLVYDFPVRPFDQPQLAN